MPDEPKDDDTPFGMGDDEDKPTEKEAKKKAEKKSEEGGCEFC
jgi:hypothetical protein